MQSFEPLNMGRSARVGQSVSTSPTSSSSSNAASRQKSCNACVRGKRRCDKTTPRCTRCAAKGLECVYQRVPPSSSPSSVTLAAQSSSNRLSEATAGMGYNKPVSAEMTDDDFEMSGFDVSDLASAGYGGHHHHHHHHHESGHRMGGGGGGSSTATTSPELVLDPSLEFSIADLLGSTSSAGGSSTGIGAATTPDDSTASMHAFWNLPSFSEPKADFPTLAQPYSFQEQQQQPPPPPQQQQQQQQQPHQQQVIRDVAILNEMRSASKCFAVDPLLVHDPRSSIGYMFDTLTKLYVGFVATRALPFAHTRLYSVNVPKTVMAAYCGAAAYASRSPETRAWAIKAVQNAAAEVHREGARAATDIEKLARCHALLVLESIRIFDGDLGLRYAAEREMGTLREWSMELVGIVEEFEGLGVVGKAGRDQPPATWDTWIFEESAKRTATVALAFQCFYSIMRSEPPDPELMGRNLPYTASRHLWNAASSVEFFRAWREQPQWTIQNFDFKEFWQYARAEDLDDFTRMMLTVQSSPDAVEHFLQGDTTIPVQNTGNCTGA